MNTHGEHGNETIRGEVIRGDLVREDTIDGKGILITGASRGLGKALAIELAALGGKIVLVARREQDLEATVQQIADAGGVAYGIPGDIQDKRFIHELVARAAHLVGPLDILIHNASTLGRVPLRYLLDTDCEVFEEVLAVNLMGPFRLTKAIAGSMAVRKRGLIIGISSDAAVNAYPTWGPYGVSKSALDHLMRSWAVELAGVGVGVLSIDPGEMDTRMHRDAVPDADPNTLARPEAVASRIVAIIRSRERYATGTRLEASAERGGTPERESGRLPEQVPAELAQSSASGGGGKS